MKTKIIQFFLGLTLVASSVLSTACSSDDLAYKNLANNLKAQLKNYTVSITFDTKLGTVSPYDEKLGGYAVAENSDQEFTFTPNQYYYVKSVLVDGKEVIDEMKYNKYTFEKIDANHTLEVSFEKIADDTVIFNPKEGEYPATLFIELSAAERRNIYYTINGDDPSLKSDKYEKAIELSKPDGYAVKAISCGEKDCSKVILKSYKIIETKNPSDIKISNTNDPFVEEDTISNLFPFFTAKNNQGDVTKFTIEIAKDEKFTEILIQDSEDMEKICEKESTCLIQIKKSISTLTNGNQYYYRIALINKDGAGQNVFSASSKFVFQTPCSGENSTKDCTELKEEKDCTNSYQDDKSPYQCIWDKECSTSKETCKLTKEICNDKLDNDGDTKKDCDDSECAKSEYCSQTCTGTVKVKDCSDLKEDTCSNSYQSVDAETKDCIWSDKIGKCDASLNTCNVEEAIEIKILTLDEEKVSLRGLKTNKLTFSVEDKIERLENISITIGNNKAFILKSNLESYEEPLSIISTKFQVPRNLNDGFQDLTLSYGGSSDVEEIGIEKKAIEEVSKVLTTTMENAIKYTYQDSDECSADNTVLHSEGEKEEAICKTAIRDAKTLDLNKYLDSAIYTNDYMYPKSDWDVPAVKDKLDVFLNGVDQTNHLLVVQTILDELSRSQLACSKDCLKIDENTAFITIFNSNKLNQEGFAIIAEALLKKANIPCYKTYDKENEYTYIIYNINDTWYNIYSDFWDGTNVPTSEYITDEVANKTIFPFADNSSLFKEDNMYTDKYDVSLSYPGYMNTILSNTSNLGTIYIPNLHQSTDEYTCNLYAKGFGYNNGAYVFKDNNDWTILNIGRINNYNLSSSVVVELGDEKIDAIDNLKNIDNEKVIEANDLKANVVIKEIKAIDEENNGLEVGYTKAYLAKELDSTTIEYKYSCTKTIIKKDGNTTIEIASIPVDLDLSKETIIKPNELNIVDGDANDLTAIKEKSNNRGDQLGIHPFIIDSISQDSASKGDNINVILYKYGENSDVEWDNNTNFKIALGNTEANIIDTVKGALDNYITPYTVEITVGDSTGDNVNVEMKGPFENDYTGSILKNIFSYKKSVSIDTIAPSTGYTTGGTLVTVKTTGLDLENSEAKLYLDDIEMLSTILDENTIQFTTLAHSKGVVNLRIKTNIEDITKNDAYTFILKGGTGYHTGGDTPGGGGGSGGGSGSGSSGSGGGSGAGDNGSGETGTGDDGDNSNTGSDDNSGNDQIFTDVSPSNNLFNITKEYNSMRILDGYREKLYPKEKWDGINTYRRSLNLNRTQALKLILNAVNNREWEKTTGEGIEKMFNDDVYKTTYENEFWVKSITQYAVDNKILNPKEEKLFKPNTAVTIGEIQTILNNVGEEDIAKEFIRNNNLKPEDQISREESLPLIRTILEKRGEIDITEEIDNTRSAAPEKTKEERKTEVINGILNKITSQNKYIDAHKIPWNNVQKLLLSEGLSIDEVNSYEDTFNNRIKELKPSLKTLILNSIGNIIANLAAKL